MTSKLALGVQKEEQDYEASFELYPFSLFINAIRADQTRRKYQALLNTFFDYISIPNTNLEERCKIFVKNCHRGGNTKCVTNCVFRYIVHLKERMNRKEIVVSTIYNYLKPIKLFCEMNDIEIKWKKITLGLPKEKNMPKIERQQLKKFKDYWNILTEGSRSSYPYTVPGKLIEQGRFDEAMKIENTFARAIKELEMPITLIYLYKAIPAILGDRLPEYHDLIIKRLHKPTFSRFVC